MPQLDINSSLQPYLVPLSREPLSELKQGSFNKDMTSPQRMARTINPANRPFHQQTTTKKERTAPFPRSLETRTINPETEGPYPTRLTSPILTAWINRFHPLVISRYPRQSDIIPTTPPQRAGCNKEKSPGCRQTRETARELRRCHRRRRR